MKKSEKKEGDAFSSAYPGQHAFGKRNAPEYWQPGALSPSEENPTEPRGSGVDKLLQIGGCKEPKWLGWMDAKQYADGDPEKMEENPHPIW